MKILLILTALLFTFSQAYANPGGIQCKPVNAIAYGTGDYLEGPENCAGFDYCIPGNLTGTPNGTITYFGNEADAIFDPFGSGYNVNMGVGEERISTRHGDITTLAHSMFDYDTAVWTELLIVTGGTGKYENATGRMVYHTILQRSPGKPISFDGPTSLTGFICTQ